VEAQNWSGIISPSRATDWSGVGATITHRTTQCGATIAAYSGSASTINNAISSCPAGQYVQLGTGTFNLSSGIDFNSKSNVTLRGNGPNNTRIIFTGNSGCNGLSGAAICVRGSNWNVGSPPNQGNLSGSFSQGQTTLTFSSTSNLNVGEIVVLDQLNDPNTDTFPNVWVCSSTTCSDEGGCSHCAGGNRGTQQVVVVTAINGNNVTFRPGLFTSYWTSSKSPKAYWGNGEISGAGVEELMIDVRAVATNGVSFFSARDSWLRAVEVDWTDRAHVLLFNATGITIRDSYFDEAQGHQSQSYGIENYVSSDCLVENNIFHHVTAPGSINGSASGCVYGYNYSLQNTFFPGSMNAFAWLHEAGVDTLLFEGNDMPAWFSDDIHGTHHFVTVFRNYSRGWESGLNDQTVPIVITWGGRFMNVIGNILGTNSYHTTYESLTSNTAIYRLGDHPDQGPSDSRVAQTLMRWGNYDTVNDAARFVASEIPSGLSLFANPVPGSQTLPNSFYLPARPSWFGNVAWPPIGPDVAGGNQDAGTTGGHVNKIPARLCYENGAKDSSGRLTAFNPDSCYGASGGGSSDVTPPGPPQNLRVI
jgi:hypothetical protein